jgi:hypothetical protein
LKAEDVKFTLTITNVLTLTQIKMHKYKKVIVFQDVKPYNLVAIYRRFEKIKLAVMWK